MPFTIGPPCYLQTHSIMVDDTFESIRFYRTDALFDGQGQYSISGLSVPLFEVVDARVSNVTIEDSSLNCSWEKAGIFTGEISVKGSVKNCKVLNCSLNGAGSSAGFAGKNSGMIEYCLVAALKEESDGYIAQARAEQARVLSWKIRSPAPSADVPLRALYPGILLRVSWA
ncbi:MAG: hypothetical protein ACLRVT_03825 [Oscillospiraceae bacterium]